MMCGASMSKRVFLKSLGLLAILGMMMPWLKRGKKVGIVEDSLPLEVEKEPNAVSRGGRLL